MTVRHRSRKRRDRIPTSVLMMIGLSWSVVDFVYAGILRAFGDTGSFTTWSPAFAIVVAVICWPRAGLRPVHERNRQACR